MEAPVSGYVIGGYDSGHFIIESTSGKEGISGFKMFEKDKSPLSLSMPRCGDDVSMSSVYCSFHGDMLNEGDDVLVSGRSIGVNNASCIISKSLLEGKKLVSCILSQDRDIQRKVDGIEKFSFAGHMLGYVGDWKEGIRVKMWELHGNQPRCKVIDEGGKRTLKCSS